MTEIGENIVENEKITLGFNLIDRWGNKFVNMSEFEPPEKSDLCSIGCQFVAFLKQCTYSMPNDYILMESLTENELEELTCYLKEIRSANEQHK